MKPQRPTYILDSGEERRRQLGLPPRSNRSNYERDNPVIYAACIIVGAFAALATFILCLYLLAA